MGAFPHIRYAAKTDLGRRRTNNEDSFGAFPESGIFCVADGMGGGDDGEVASAATVKAVERFTRECPLPAAYTYPIEGMVSGVRSAVNAASSWIARRTQQKGLKGCGSTFVCICFDASRPNVAVALHAGDSRLYRIRGRSMDQMTVDHSAAELIGAKNEDDINPMFRGMILRAVGIQPVVELERTEVRLKAGDWILICSDGLSRMLSDRQMLSIVRAGKDPDATVERLVAAANDAGGVDNITVELIEVGEFPPPLPTSPLANGGGGQTGSTKETADVEIPPEPSTEDDFVPSTAEDGENAEETLNIPESDTEDDLPSAAPPPKSAEPVRPLKKMSCIRRNLIVAGVIFASIALGSAVVIARVRAKEEAEKKQVVETKNHRQEQKDSLQAVEEKRKAEQERKVREAEEERVRLEIQTLKKQKELAEKARKEAEIREREERAAREKAEAEAQREKEARAKEAARQEELRKAEEKRKAMEAEAKAEEARAAAEKRRKELLAQEEAARLERLRYEDEKKRLAEEAEKKAREKREQEVLARQDLAISAFSNIVESGAATRCYARVQRLIPDGVPQDFHQKMARVAKTGLSRDEKIDAIRALTTEVQQITRSLEEYSALTVENVKLDLADATDGGAKEFLEKVSVGIENFSQGTSGFVKRDASDPDAQQQCALIIRSLPTWFDF